MRGTTSLGLGPIGVWIIFMLAAGAMAVIDYGYRTTGILLFVVGIVVAALVVLFFDRH